MKETKGSWLTQFNVKSVGRMCLQCFRCQKSSWMTSFYRADSMPVSNIMLITKLASFDGVFHLYVHIYHMLRIWMLSVIVFILRVLLQLFPTVLLETQWTWSYSTKESWLNKTCACIKMCVHCLMRLVELTVTGNGLANSGDYVKAIKCFTEAIRLDPSEFRLSFIFWISSFRCLGVYNLWKLL